MADLPPAGEDFGNLALDFEPGVSTVPAGHQQVVVVGEAMASAQALGLGLLDCLGFGEDSLSFISFAASAEFEHNR